MTQVGEVSLALNFDTKSLNGSMKAAQSQMQTAGKSSGSLFGDAWSVAAGSLISKGIGKIASTISSSVGSAINRVDTLQNFPKVMESMGISGDEASSSIQSISGRLDGLPSTLNDVASNVQKLAATMGNLNRGTVNATSVGLALNDMFLAGGKGTQAASNALEQYNQMLAVGKVDQMAWNSLVNASPGQMDQLAKSLLGAGAGQRDLYDAMKNGTVSFDDLNAKIVELDTKGGQGFGSFEEQARNATGGIGTALENVQNRVGKAVADIINEIGSDRISSTINTISSSFKDIAKVAAPVFKFLVDHGDVVISVLGGILAVGFAQKVANGFKIIGAAAKANPTTMILSALAAVILLVIQHWDQVWPAIQQGCALIGQAIGAVGAFIGQVFQNVASAVGTAIGAIVAFIQPVTNVVSSVANLVIGIVQSCIGLVVSIFRTGWSIITSIFNVAGTFFATIVNKIKTPFMAIANFFKGIFTSAFNAIKSAFQPIASFFSGVLGNLKNMFNGFVNTVKGIFRGIGQTIGNIVTSTVKGIVNGVLSTAEKIINGPIDAFNGVLDVINKIPGVDIKKLDRFNLPRLAEGGFASSATAAIFGEAGREVALPLDRNTDNWAGLLSQTLVEEMESRTPGVGGGLTINMTNEIKNGLDADEIGRRLTNSIRRLTV